MRSEAEVRQMLAEVTAISNRFTPRYPDYTGRCVAFALETVLQNILEGPHENTDGCACTGPPGLCRCTIARLAIRPEVTK